MQEQGWIKLHRKIRENYLWNEKPFDKCRAWIDIILSANHEDRTILFNGHRLDIRKGSYLTSINKLAENWGWSKNKVSRFLCLLERDDMIYKNSTHNSTLITVVKYDDFQCQRDTKRDSNESTNEYTDETLTRHRRITNKNDKECNKNYKEEKKRTSPSAFQKEPTDDELREMGYII